MKKGILIIAILCTSILNIAAQGNIEGIIKDKNNNNVEFGKVTVFQDGKLITGKYADIDGFYFIDDLKAGKYELIIEFSGSKSSPKDIIIADAENIVINMTLGTVNELDVVDVIYYKGLFDKEKPHVIETKGEDIKNMGVQTIEDAISINPGVTKDSKGNISFRGARPGSTAYYIDGMRVNGQLDIPMSAIYTMNVYNGGIPARFGNTVSAVIDIRTKSYFDFFE